MNRTSVGCTERCFTVAPGRSQTVKLTFTRSTAAFNTYAGGQLPWSVRAGQSLNAHVALAAGGCARMHRRIRRGWNSHRGGRASA